MARYGCSRRRPSSSAPGYKQTPAGLKTTSASPPGADLPGGVSKGLLLTQSGSSRSPPQPPISTSPAAPYASSRHPRAVCPRHFAAGCHSAKLPASLEWTWEGLRAEPPRRYPDTQRPGGASSGSRQDGRTALRSCSAFSRGSVSARLPPSRSAMSWTARAGWRCRWSGGDPTETSGVLSSRRRRTAGELLAMVACVT